MPPPGCKCDERFDEIKPVRSIAEGEAAERREGAPAVSR